MDNSVQPQQNISGDASDETQTEQPLQPIAENVFNNPVPAQDSSIAAPTPPQPIVPDSSIPAAPQPANQLLFDQIVEKIIEQQEAIIGPVAVEQARKVHELKIDWPQHDVDIEGNPQAAIDELVKQYQELFGQIAVQVSKEAVAAIMAQLPADQQPKSLQ